MEIKTENVEALVDYSIVKTEYSVQEDDLSVWSALDVQNIKEEPEKFEDVESLQDNSTSLKEIKEEPGKGHLPCCICGETFKNDRLTRQHIRTHFKSWGSLKCRKCGKVFKSQYNLTYHNLVVHGRMREEEAMARNHTCKHCGKGFYSKDRYQKHLTVHSNVRNFQCSLCSKNFKIGYSLDQHLKFAHSSERPFSCPTCNFAFKYKQGLTQHLKVHEKKTPGQLRCVVPLTPSAIKKEGSSGVDCDIAIKSEIKSED